MDYSLNFHPVARKNSKMDACRRLALPHCRVNFLGVGVFLKDSRHG